MTGCCAVGHNEVDIHQISLNSTFYKKSRRRPTRYTKSQGVVRAVGYKNHNEADIHQERSGVRYKFLKNGHVKLRSINITLGLNGDEHCSKKTPLMSKQCKIYPLFPKRRPMAQIRSFFHVFINADA